jgi:hypothetical protein
MKPLRESGRSRAFDPTQTHEPPEGVAVEPRLSRLGWKMLVQQVDFLFADLFLQYNENVGLAEISIVLRDLVFEDQLTSKCVPGELGDHSVVLVPVVAVVGQDDIRSHDGLELLEDLLNLPVLARKEAILKRMQRDSLLLATPQESPSALLGFGVALSPSSKYYPMESGVGMLPTPVQDGSTAPDLNVICMGSKAENGTDGFGGKFEHFCDSYGTEVVVGGQHARRNGRTPRLKLLYLSLSISDTNHSLLDLSNISSIDSDVVRAAVDEFLAAERLSSGVETARD